MTQNIPLDPGQRAVAPFFDHIQELLGASAPSFRVEILSDTQVRIPAGSGNDQVGIAIEGRYRWITANLDSTHPGGAAGARGVGAGPYELWLVTGDNSYSGTPTVDATVTTFTATIVANGVTPTGTRKRKVAEIDWDGDSITAVRQLAGTPKGGSPGHFDAPVATVSPLRVKGATGQSAPLADFLTATGESVASVSATGALTAVGATLSAAGGKTTLALTSTGANTGLTLGGDANLYRPAANTLMTDDALTVAGALTAQGAVAITGTITLGGDANLYRSAADTLKTDDALEVAGNLTVSGTITNTGLASALAGKQGLHANLTALSGLSGVADRVAYFTGAGTLSLATFTSFGRTLVDDADATAARTTLGLGSIATQAASAVAVTGGTIAGITDLAIADGGTGASTATDARTNLGLGSMAVQNSGAVAITGGTITGITDLNVVDGGTGASNAADARANLGAAPLVSPAFTGAPTAPTPAIGSDDGSLATTEFVRNVVPAGVIWEYAGASAPAGWLLCDGSAVSRTTYAALWDALRNGTTSSPYGNGDGSTTFNLPDKRDRFSVGVSATKTRGSTGGAATVTLTAAQSGLRTHDHAAGTLAIPAHGHGHALTLPNHFHTINHTHTIPSGVTSFGADADSGSGFQFGATGANSYRTHAHGLPAMAVPQSSTVNSGNPTTLPAIGGSVTDADAITLSASTKTATPQNVTTGGSAASESHENLPPYLAVNFIIKT